jgi:hypothetical protein
MVKILSLLFLVIVGTSVMAQTDTTKTKSAEEDELLTADPAFNTQVTSLLPEGMGPVKRFLWSEQGLMRKISFFELTPEKREREILIRRRMLQTHQALGMAAVGTMLISSISGQMLINKSHSTSPTAGEDMLTLKSVHDAAVTTTMIAYGTTFLLQFLTPPPVIIRKNKGWSNMKAHKTLAYLHFTGMVATPIIGRMIYGSSSLENGKSDDLKKFHQISGYITTGLYTGAMVVMKF